MPKSQTTQSDQWLADFTDDCRKNVAAVRRIDRKKVEIDIAARNAEVAWIKGYIPADHGWSRNSKSMVSAKKSGAPAWARAIRSHRCGGQFSWRGQGRYNSYIKGRRALGDNGRFGLAYAIELSHQLADESEISPYPEMRGECNSETPDAEKPASVRASLLLVLPNWRAHSLLASASQRTRHRRWGAISPPCRCGVIG